MFKSAPHLPLFFAATLMGLVVALSPPAAYCEVLSTSHISYALLVGSNQPGEGQEALHWAREDANKFRELLIELGDYSPNNIIVLNDPGNRELEVAIQGFSKRLTRHRANGEQTVFTFYYSGHARAEALTLGPDEMSLETVRSLLEELPSTVKLVILDACQTGAISNIKGVTPTKDFSYNSVSRLNTSGMAVMASSSASELSQESARLGGSFFTHHLLVGLRGGADTDGNGLVTLSEIYAYASCEHRPDRRGQTTRHPGNRTQGKRGHGPFPAVHGQFLDRPGRRIGGRGAHTPGIGSNGDGRNTQGVGSFLSHRSAPQ
jgi:hypothetical protein